MIKYRVIARKSPKDKSVKYYPTTASVKLTFDELVDNIVAECTLTRADVRACIEQFNRHIINALKNGKTVQIDGLGTVTYALKGKGSDSEAKFTAENITRLTPHFRFASSMRKALERKNLQFEKFNWVRPAGGGE